MNTTAQHTAIFADEFRLIPLAEVRESATNPRKHFDPNALDELTKSIRQQGVIQPIVVRRSQAHGHADCFEIVTGARRYRASINSGLATIPAIVRVLGDDQVIEIQMIENLQREDIHPLDEAQGYQTLLDKTGLEIAAIAAKVGKSESYIYQRLKLLALTEKIQKAFFADKISAGHAILIARLQPIDQAQALKECLENSANVRRLGEWIDRNVHMDLHGAPFKKDDAELIPAAGSCIDCPKRTGFHPELFPDIAKKDTCTDPKCFHAKLDAFTARRLGELKQKGDAIVKITTQYHSPGKAKDVLDSSQYKEAGAAECPDTKTGLIIDNVGQGKTLRVCTNPKCKQHFLGVSSRNARLLARTGRNPFQELKYKAGKQAREQTIAVIAADTVKLESADLKLLAEAFLIELWHEQVKELFKRRSWLPKISGGNSDYTAAARDQIKAMTPRQVAGLLMECVLRSRLCPENDDLAKIAKQSGVDFYKLERQTLAALTEKEDAKRDKEKQTPAPKPAEKKLPAGKCRYCGCTETTPCHVGKAGACAWYDKDRTLCTNPQCLRKFNADKQAKKPEKKK